jgi:DNA-directed RNA polymerase specialized sigma24 family protein
VRSLTAADADDVIQEGYSRLWHADFSHVGNGRSYFYTIIRNLLTEQARHARSVPAKRCSRSRRIPLGLSS